MTSPEYLGDRVYATEESSGSITLTTGHHEPAHADDVIYLDREVIDALLRYIKKARDNYDPTP